MMKLNDVAKLLINKDNILILIHRFPDGDALGCSYALCSALQSMGKKCKIGCADDVPQKFGYVKKVIVEQDFEPEYFVAVDVAASHLLGKLEQVYGDMVDLRIDHHGKSTPFAKENYVEPKSASCAEIIYLLIKEMGVNITPEMADCLFTGVSTDTGCFKFSNVTSRTHKIAAELMELGCNSAEICKVMFDTKSKSRIAIEKAVLDNLRFEFNGLCAIVTISLDMLAKTNAQEDDIDGISSLPRQIEGVEAGITLREIKSGEYKISFRTSDRFNAAAIAEKFGGGGHSAAAGCSISGNESDVVDTLLKEVEKSLRNRDMI